MDVSALRPPGLLGGDGRASNVGSTPVAHFGLCEHLCLEWLHAGHVLVGVYSYWAPSGVVPQIGTSSRAGGKFRVGTRTWRQPPA